jgi:hypothetical protein
LFFPSLNQQKGRGKGKGKRAKNLQPMGRDQPLKARPSRFPLRFPLLYALPLASSPSTSKYVKVAVPTQGEAHTPSLDLGQEWFLLLLALLFLDSNGPRLIHLATDAKMEGKQAFPLQRWNSHLKMSTTF